MRGFDTSLKVEQACAWLAECGRVTAPSIDYGEVYNFILGVALVGALIWVFTALERLNGKELLEHAFGIGVAGFVMFLFFQFFGG